MPIDKYSGYSQEVARILRKFDEVVNNHVSTHHGYGYNSGYREAMCQARVDLERIAKTADREFEELQAVSR